MLAFVFISVGDLWGYLITIVGMSWRFVAYAAGGAVLNIVLNLLLVPDHGAVGAAWATVVTELVVNGLALWTVFRAIEFRPSLDRIARAVVAAGVTVLLAGLAGRAGLLPGLIVAGPVYVGGLLLLRAITTDEIREALRREGASPA
jgi:O-antigen/teichoic acid export membrane protein